MVLGGRQHGYLYYPLVGYTRVCWFVTRVLQSTYPTKHAFETTVKRYQVYIMAQQQAASNVADFRRSYSRQPPPRAWVFTPARLKYCLLLPSSSSIHAFAGIRSERATPVEQRTHAFEQESGRGRSTGARGVGRGSLPGRGERPVTVTVKSVSATEVGSLTLLLPPHTPFLGTKYLEFD